jgi:alkanesulfonate monooxygenase SsuD/methylene tetrahydromethanopterin reductase-like flavin-dependent oxidoreductase (luciferase family)
VAQVQFGWALPMPALQGAYSTQSAYLERLAQALELVEQHFHSVWCTDHLQYQCYKILEGWTMITYLAPLYPQLSFGNLVLNQSFRNPGLVAKMATTFQHMSGGRLILGMGAGWNEEEYRAYGYPFPSACERVAELDEALQILQALWREESVTIRGKHYQVVEARCVPRPVPLPPIVIGASRPRMLSVVARYADWWSGNKMTLNEYRQQRDECERACLAVQRDPKTLQRTIFEECVCRPTEQALQPFRQQNPFLHDFLGTPTQIIERMLEFMDLGVDYFMFDTGDLLDLTTLELLVNEVFPVIQNGNGRQLVPGYADSLLDTLPQ